MLKSFKTEIRPTEDQAMKIRRTIGVCRFVYNLYIATNQERYKQKQRFMNGMDFSKWLNNEYLPNNPDKFWVKEVSSKSVKQSIMNAETAYKRFFKGQGKFPRFKKKSRSDVKMYFVKTDAKATIQCQRHRIKIPTLGWIRFKEYGYFPQDGSIHSGTVSIVAGRYYVSVLADVEPPAKPVLNDHGIGIDLGVKELAVISDGTVYKNINKTKEVKHLEKKLKREQRSLSRKYESYKKLSNIEKGKATRHNILQQQLIVQRVHQRLTNIRADYINKMVSELVKTKPAWITIEDLNVKGMMKNRHLSKAIAVQEFCSVRTKLTSKCAENGIELRIVDRFYPSSKTCHECGIIKKDLKLSDRIYECECGYRTDRDLNAALNLRDAKIYQTAS